MLGVRLVFLVNGDRDEEEEEDAELVLGSFFVGGHNEGEQVSA